MEANGPDMARTSPNPVLVEAWRGPLLENVHRGSVAIVASDGALVEGWGDVDRLILPRSSYKILQALPLVESGAADAFSLGAKELALACASHSGAPIHTEPVAGLLKRLDLGEADLLCGRQTPQDKTARTALFSSGGKPNQLHNNCSGKHAGFLTLSRHLGASSRSYVDVDHPVQIAACDAISEVAQYDARTAFGLDGCSAPNFAIPLRALATAMARLATPATLKGARRAAVERLREAMVRHPDLVAGEGRACTDFMRAAADAAGHRGTVAKTGADGVFTAILPARGLGVALKIDDGSTAAAEAVMAGVLTRLGVVSPTDVRISSRVSAPIRNRVNTEVGRLQLADLGVI